MTREPQSVTEPAGPEPRPQSLAEPAEPEARPQSLAEPAEAEAEPSVAQPAQTTPPAADPRRLQSLDFTYRFRMKLLGAELPRLRTEDLLETPELGAAGPSPGPGPSPLAEPHPSLGSPLTERQRARRRRARLGVFALLVVLAVVVGVPAVAKLATGSRPPGPSSVDGSPAQLTAAARPRERAGSDSPAAARQARAQGRAHSVEPAAQEGLPAAASTQGEPLRSARLAASPSELARRPRAEVVSPFQKGPAADPLVQGQGMAPRSTPLSEGPVASPGEGSNPAPPVATEGNGAREAGLSSPERTSSSTRGRSWISVQ